MCGCLDEHMHVLRVCGCMCVDELPLRTYETNIHLHTHTPLIEFIRVPLYMCMNSVAEVVT